jgi:hypothetical protein
MRRAKAAPGGSKQQRLRQGARALAGAARAPPLAPLPLHSLAVR